MSRTLSATYTAGVTLTSAADDPATIAVTGLLYGGLDGAASIAWQIVNLGSVQGPAFGLYLAGGGSIGNLGLVSSASTGVLIGGRTGTVVNAGRILAAGAAVYLSAGGGITNQSGGTIAGYAGVYEQAAAVSVVNAGTIEGSATGLIGTGIVLLAGGDVTNLSSGLISGYDGIYGSEVADRLVNSGSIEAFGTSGIGVAMQAGGTVINTGDGSVTGYDGIVVNSGAMTVVNQGRIVASGFAVRLQAGAANRVVIDPGAVFRGIVEGGDTIPAASGSTLELASGGLASGAGTLSGIGTQFLDFAQVSIDAGASWNLGGYNSLSAGTTLTNAGTLSVAATLSDGGLLVNDGGIRLDRSSVTLAAVTGVGSLSIGGGGTLELPGAVGARQTIAFETGVLEPGMLEPGMLETGVGVLGVDPTGFAGEIDGFAHGDTIVLTGVTDGFAPSIVNGNTLQVRRSGHPWVDLTLRPGGDYSGETFSVDAVGAVTEEAPSFLRDTRIRTERGEVPVQNLAAGDIVVTWSGESRPVIWIGHGSVALGPERHGAATPIIVRRGALADGVPWRDLRITKGHSLFIDGLLIPAEFLVNHRSIRWDTKTREAVFYHIELATHDVLVANGAAAESYRDDGNRWLFQNANEGWTQPPMPPCAPVLTGGPIVDAVWRRLLDRAGDSPGLALTDDPDVHLLVDVVRLDAITRSGQVLVFDVAAKRGTVRLVSRAAVPQALGVARDPRRLGIALRRLVVRRMARFRVIEMTDGLLEGDGFHAYEVANGLRWTDGDAVVPAAAFTGFEGTVELVVVVGGATGYAAVGDLWGRVAA